MDLRLLKKNEFNIRNIVRRYKDRYKNEILVFKNSE